MNEHSEKSLPLRGLGGQTSSTPHILIVDDNPYICRLARRLLERHGFAVVSAMTGKDGVIKAQCVVPDLILLDLKLPDISGFMVKRLLMSDENLKKIPVLISTGVEDHVNLLEDACMGLKVSGFLRKPWTEETLLEQIRRCLRSRTADANHDPQVAAKSFYEPGNHLLRRGVLTVNLVSRKVCIRNNSILRLHEKRFNLLCALMRRNGPVSRLDLMEEVWPGISNPNVVEVTVLRLRRDFKPFNDIRIMAARNGYELICDGSDQDGEVHSRAERSIPYMM